MLEKGEAREGLLLWEISCSCSLDCVSQSWISDACLVIPNAATEVGFFQHLPSGYHRVDGFDLAPIFLFGARCNVSFPKPSILSVFLSSELRALRTFSMHGKSFHGP